MIKSRQSEKKSSQNSKEVFNFQRIFTSQIFYKLSCGILGLLSVITVIYGFIQTSKELGGIDFHSYWYSGLFIRQDANPFAAYLANETPSVPIPFIDGNTIREEPVGNENLANVPANTAPIVLILSVFSFFSWPTAKFLWLICNLFFMLAIPWIAIKVVPENVSFLQSDKLLLALIFYSIYGSRNNLSSGQTSLFVLFLMVLSFVYYQKYKLLSGILLGIALSKYSLALPLFLLYVLRKEYKLIFIAVGIQLFGAIIVSLISQSSLISIFIDYFNIMMIHTSLPGIHLGNLIPEQSIKVIIGLVLSTITFGLLGIYLKKIKPPFSLKYKGSSRLFELHLLTILTFWTLLIAYHRAYDTVTCILFFLLVFVALRNTGLWSFNHIKYQKRVLVIVSLITFITLWLPASSFGFFLKDNASQYLPVWLSIQGGSITLILLLLLFYTIILLFEWSANPSNSVRISLPLK